MPDWDTNIKSCRSPLTGAPRASEATQHISSYLSAPETTRFVTPPCRAKVRADLPQLSTSVMPEVLGLDPQTDGVRRMGRWSQSDGSEVTGLIEWTSKPDEKFRQLLDRVKRIIPTEGDWPGEVQTFKILLEAHIGAQSGILYDCPQGHTDLHQVLCQHPAPSMGDRVTLIKTIMEQIRSLNFHFELLHPALRTESFVFVGHGPQLDFSRPYVLDWTRQAQAEIYQRPGCHGDKVVLADQIWSLMMILSEIVEWKPMDRSFSTGGNLTHRKMARVSLTTSPKWHSQQCAAFFNYGFEFTDKEPDTPEGYSRWDARLFFDGLFAILK
ncbi:uncharacterized protein E0L32_002385 [Thyridium curvatum]|uniref:Protein kinase domain-containing protein n=1 Tax=Thyridium curvatum TaxID=1093900 RepID=A0A507APX2_9PEZI|nr:uncharacterized protein E0L32_002385 [Thyridium curvatum]TPX06889.1 hypothetical protein E0L32_002385 [Thyridium curvatum]